MAATHNTPTYTVYVLHGGGKYDLSKIVTRLDLDEQDNGIAQKVTIGLVQVAHDGKYTADFVSLRDTVYVYANTGSGSQEIFRGYIWERQYTKNDSYELTLVCYDNLIYLQESEEYMYFSAGKSTASIFKSICSSKGISLSYQYGSITHSQLTVRGTLADVFIDDLIEPVRHQTGQRGVIRSDKGVLRVFIEGEGSQTVYNFSRGAANHSYGNITEIKVIDSMDGIVTKVIILGQEKDGKKAPIKATVTGNTSTYGTIQKVLSSSDGDDLAKVKAEANQTIKDSGKPTRTLEIKAVNNPFVRKGDTIHIEESVIGNQYAYVMSVSHDALKNTMTMEVRLK